MLNINFLQYQSELKIIQRHGKRFIWDNIRKKHFVLTPEELVRQLVILYLIKDRGYTKNGMAVEKQLIVNTLKKRCDILIYDQNAKPYLLVECKSPKVPITQATFNQIARYNLALNVTYLVVTNGLQTYCCRMDLEEGKYVFLEAIPLVD